MASIGDLFMKVIAEMSGFEAEVVKGSEKAGEKGGKALTASMAANLKTGAIKAAGLATAGALAIASKGAAELANIQARFQSETGASADEAKHAAEVINRVSGSQRVSLEAVADAAVRVKRDLGLVGPEADKMTETIVKFARVTRQDASAAVSQLDDILDSWGLTAADADSVLNKLLVSQHKFGGEISETSKTLAALAPSMRAANMSVDDGIALLGLFGAKGLDAGQASAAFSKALTKVKSPKELQDLITDIAATEDPFKRAQKAADLFGAKAGAKLANALAGAHLDDYKISMEEAAGATDKAADALDSTFGAQIAKKISETGAALRQLGADFGPGITGAASLATLLATVGGDKMIKGLAAKLGGSAAVSALSNAASKLAGPVGKALGIGISSAAALSLEEGITGAASQGRLSAGMDKLGTLLGTRLGTALSVGFAAVVIVELVKTLKDIADTTKAQTNAIGESVGQQLAEGTLSGLEQSRGALEKGISDLGGIFDLIPGISQISAAARKDMEAQLDLIKTAIVRKTQDAREGLATTLAAGAPAITKAMQTAVGGIPPELVKVAKAAGYGAKDIGRNIAEGVKSARALVTDAMSILHDALEHEMSPAKERATLLGQLAGKELAKGLKSKDPVVRQAAEDAKNAIIQRLEQLVPANGKLGKKSGAELAKALKSKDPEVRAAAERIKSTIEKKLDETKAKAAGKKKGQEVADGVRAKKGAVGAAALALAKKVAQTIIATIKSYGSGGGSRSQARAIGGPVEVGVPYLVNENTPRSETFVPSRPGYVLTHADAMAAVAGAAGGPGGLNVHLNTYGLPMYAATPVEVGRQVRRAIRAGTPTPPLRRASWERP